MLLEPLLALQAPNAHISLPFTASQPFLYCYTHWSFVIQESHLCSCVHGIVIECSLSNQCLWMHPILCVYLICNCLFCTFRRYTFLYWILFCSHECIFVYCMNGCSNAFTLVYICTVFDYLLFELGIFVQLQDLFHKMLAEWSINITVIIAIIKSLSS
jgi:hypothetical protein